MKVTSLYIGKVFLSCLGLVLGAVVQLGYVQGLVAEHLTLISLYLPAACSAVSLLGMAGLLFLSLYSKSFARTWDSFVHNGRRYTDDEPSGNELCARHLAGHLLLSSGLLLMAFWDYPIPIGLIVAVAGQCFSVLQEERLAKHWDHYLEMKGRSRARRLHRAPDSETKGELATVRKKIKAAGRLPQKTKGDQRQAESLEPTHTQECRIL